MGESHHRYVPRKMRLHQFVQEGGAAMVIWEPAKDDYTKTVNKIEGALNILSDGDFDLFSEEVMNPSEVWGCVEQLNAWSREVFAGRFEIVNIITQFDDSVFFGILDKNKVKDGQ